MRRRRGSYARSVPESTEPRFSPLVELPRRRLFGFAVCGATSAPARVDGALAAVARWRRPDPPVVLIDLELADLVEPTIAAALAELAERGIDPDAVMVRVPAYAPAMARLEHLADRGIGVVVRTLDVDQAELGLLDGAAIDGVQLPPAAVAACAHDPRAAAALRELIAVAHRHDWLILACDVQHADQLAALAELGCDLVCGPAVGPAMGRADAARTIDRYLGGPTAGVPN